MQFSIQEQLLSRNLERFRGGLVVKARGLLYHSTVGSRVMKKKKVQLQSALLRCASRFTGPIWETDCGCRRRLVCVISDPGERERGREGERERGGGGEEGEREREREREVRTP